MSETVHQAMRNFLWDQYVNRTAEAIIFQKMSGAESLALIRQTWPNMAHAILRLASPDSMSKSRFLHLSFDRQSAMAGTENSLKNFLERIDTRITECKLLMLVGQHQRATA